MCGPNPITVYTHIYPPTRTALPLPLSDQVLLVLLTQGASPRNLGSVYLLTEQLTTPPTGEVGNQASCSGHVGSRRGGCGEEQMVPYVLRGSTTPSGVVPDKQGRHKGQYQTHRGSTKPQGQRGTHRGSARAIPDP